ncbi:hypothetical protein KEM54_005830 [Ascosphaera aggregata]|nr:hypothetical protein KEM54_005830 [Ascosphaera aggregata]
MAKKRKASVAGAKSVSSVQTRFSRNETFDNSEDEFETGRDQILLEEAPDAKRRRKLQEDEEVFQESDEDVDGYLSPSDDDDNLSGEESSRQNVARITKLGRDHSPLDDDETGKDEQEEYTGWGSLKSDYYSADAIETEADALAEEEEAKKLQKKHLQSLKEDDFGLDEEEWLVAGKAADHDADKDAKPITEVSVNLEISGDMSSEERRNLLRQRYPEFEPLSKDILELQPLHQELAVLASKSHQIKPLGPAPVAVVKFRALTAYLAAVSAYFFLLTSPSRKGEKMLALSPAELREHPIMETILHTKTQWEEVRGLVVPDSEDNEVVNGEVDEEAEASDVSTKESKADRSKVVEVSSKAIKKTKVERAIEKARAKAEAERRKKLDQTETDLADLANHLKQQKMLSKKFRPPLQQDASDFGDETHLEDHELQEKAAKKRSLRFYTSQIDHKANKRGAAGRDAGGDMDLPYRERLKDRQARLLAQAEKRGREAPDALGGESDEEDYRVARELRNEKAKDDDGSDSDDYYNMVASRAKAKKDEKKKRAEAYADALKQSRHIEVEKSIGPDGKRAITYAIQKNKGLTPRRSKDVRNPRVKKRKKFAEKQKKLGSIRQIYKGGEGRGGYGGELTGIKTNVVKSVKL